VGAPVSCSGYVVVSIKKCFWVLPVFLSNLIHSKCRGAFRFNFTVCVAKLMGGIFSNVRDGYC